MQVKYKQQYGDSPFGGGFGNQGMNMNDFQNFWEGIDEFFGSSKNQGGSSKGKDIMSNAEI